MKTILNLLLLIPVLSFGQSSEIWNSFYDQETDLIGFKNSEGETKLEAKFGLFTIAKKFDKIIAVSEFKNDSTYDSYYLLKDGKRFGKNNLYVSDYSYACECEGFIKFKDKGKDLVGFFNSEAKVAIPAEYNTVSQIKNGVFVGLKNATKHYWEENKHSGCNHWSWEGGKGYLIDSSNVVLVENFEFNENINFYSLKILDEPSEDKNRINFEGINGKYYSFLDNKTVFEKYLSRLLDDLTLENLIQNSYSKVVYFWKGGWTSEPNQEFIKKNGDTILKRFESIHNENVKYSIFTEDYTPVPDNLKYIFDERRDNCGNINTSKYPTFNLVVTFNNEMEKLSHQDHYKFIKINDTFKLLSVSININ